MKDPSGRHTSSPRPAPYRKRKPSVSPSRLARRRAHERDASEGHTCPSTRARDVRPTFSEEEKALPRTRKNEQPGLSDQPATDERHSRLQTGAGGKRATSRFSKSSMSRISYGPPQQPQSSGSYSMSTHADVPGPPLRVHLAPATGTSAASAQDTSQKTPSPESVDSFLRSIQLPDKSSSTSTPIPNPKFESSPGLSSPSFRLPTSPVGTVPQTACQSTGRSTSNQVSLVYKGYPFTYDLATLPNDPTGTIALLRATNSDPGAYILVGAHYRRTGRSRAACTIIRSLLALLDDPSNVEKGKGSSQPSSSNNTLGSPIDLTKSVFKGSAMRPAMLLLAACEMDISREDPTGPESVRHVAKAHELFREVYGTVSDEIVAGAARPPVPTSHQNALGLEFPSNQNCVTSSGGPSAPVPTPVPTLGPQPPLSPEVESAKRLKSLERELGATRDSHKRLREKLASTSDILLRAEDRIRTLERRLHDTRVQLDASKDENLTLHQRLTESVNGTSVPESRVWGKLRDLLLDNFGGGTRGE